MQSGGRFVVNEKNLGGKNVIRRQLLEHHNAIVHAKPTINTREKPRAHIDANLDPKQKLNKGHNAFEYNEVYHTFKKLSDVKGGYIDNKKPVSYDLAKKAIPKNKKKNDFINREHLLHLKSQRRRVENIGKSMTERKKNVFDPIAHPSILFRRAEQPNKDVSLDFMFYTNAGTAKNVTTGFDLSKMKSKFTKRPISAYNSKMENYDLGSISPIKMNQTGISFLEKDMEDIPEFTGDTTDETSYRNFKLKVIDYIIEKRIYKAQDLELLRERVKVKNPKLEHFKIDEMFELINNDLDR